MSNVNRVLRLPALVGGSLSTVATPALLLDMTKVEQNVSMMHAAIARWIVAGKNRSVRLRPHAKALKSEPFIRWVLGRSDHGVHPAGVCCQTVSEAESALQAGSKDILLTNQLWTASKVARLIYLKACNPDIRVGCLIDDPENAPFLAQQLVRSGGKVATLDVFIEADAGSRRCGCSSADEVVAVAKAVIAHPKLYLRGLHCYHGLNQHIRSREKKRHTVMSTAVATARAASDSMLKVGIGFDSNQGFQIVTGGGTGTFLYELEGGVHNEIQPGSYLVMDTDYAANDCMLMPDNSGEEVRFQPALFVHGTVISRKGSRRVIDAGSKSCDLLSGPPRIVAAFDEKLNRALEDAAVWWQLGGDEHGILHNVPDGLLPLGSTIQLVPSHCDPTVNLHDHYVCVRKVSQHSGGAVVEHIWPIDARGPAL